MAVLHRFYCTSFFISDTVQAYVRRSDTLYLNAQLICSHGAAPTSQIKVRQRFCILTLIVYAECSTFSSKKQLLQQFLLNYSSVGILETLANSEDPDEMPPIVAFHQDLHCLLS